MLSNFWEKPKSRRIAVIIALLGTVTPLGGLHKFYLGQPLWGIIYLLLWTTPIPRFACAVDAVWYLLQTTEDFENRFNPLTNSVDYGKENKSEQDSQLTRRVEDVAEALRSLEKLREQGLLLDDEFEQKRRQLIAKL